MDYASQIAVLSLFLTVKIFWIFPNHVVNFDQIPDPVNTLPDPGKAITDHGGGVWVVVVLEGLWFSPLGLCSGP